MLRGRAARRPRGDLERDGQCPRGTSLKNARAPTTIPATTSTGVTTAECDDAPARTSAAPATRVNASSRRSTGSSPAGAPSAIRARIVITAASPTSGNKPRNTHRQPKASATVPLIAGPIRPGSTHALDSTANMRGCSAAGYARPIAAYATAGIAPAPTPCTVRAATSTPIVGASPPATRPSAKSESPAMNGRAGPLRSASRPAATTPKRLPRKNALNTQPRRPMSPRSSSMTLRIVAIASPSKPTSVIVNTSPSVSALRPGAQTPSEFVVRARTGPSCPMVAADANRWSRVGSACADGRRRPDGCG